MQIITQIDRMQRQADSYRADRKTIAFVPTMGYLHEGHLSLVRKAREVGDVVVVSIFVNPTQFGPDEDYGRYPRDFERDRALVQQNGSDVLFVPKPEDMYPSDYATFVEVEGLTSVLCGASRPGHFRGVTTVVAKLFNIVKPHIAVFGQKDAQQAVVVQRMVKDLDMGIEILVVPIVREKDGLAMSSRNTYLSREEREEARVLFRSLCMAEELISGGERRAGRVVRDMRRMIEAVERAQIDYVSIVDHQTLQPISELSGSTLIAIAVTFGKTRLIDNIVVEI